MKRQQSSAAIVESENGVVRSANLDLRKQRDALQEDLALQTDSIMELLQLLSNSVTQGTVEELLKQTHDSLLGDALSGFLQVTKRTTS